MLDDSPQQPLYISNSHASDDLFHSISASFANPTAQQAWWQDNQGAAFLQPYSTQTPADLTVSEAFYGSSLAAPQHMSPRALYPPADGTIEIETNATSTTVRYSQPCSNVYASRPGSTTSSSQSRQTISATEQEPPMSSCSPSASKASEYIRAEHADPSMHWQQHLNAQHHLDAVPAVQRLWVDQHVAYQYHPDAVPAGQPFQHLNFQHQPDAEPAVQPDATQHVIQWEHDTQGPYQRLLQDDANQELDADTWFGSTNAIPQAAAVGGETQHAENAAHHDEGLMQDADMVQCQEAAIDFAAAQDVESLLTRVQEVLQQSTILNSPMRQIQAPTSERLYELLIKHGLLYSTGWLLHICIAVGSAFDTLSQVCTCRNLC